MSPEPQRFLVLTPAFDGSDGISELTRQVVDTLVKAAGQARVEVWTLAGEALDGEAGPFRTARGSRARIIRWTLARAATRMDGVTVVVLHAHLAPLARMLAWRGARVVVFLIGIEVWRRLRPRERRAIESARGLIAISRATAARFHAANPDLASVPVTVCPLGTRAHAAPAAPEKGHAVGPDGDGLGEGFALIVGRLSAEERYKGHDQLIAAWPAVCRQVPRATLVVVGDGDDRGRLESLVAAAGLGGRAATSGAVRFVGRVGAGALASLYRRAAFFVMPSAREGFGLVYLEAMQAGKPCIAAHGAADEIVEDGVEGFVIDPDAPDQLMTSVVRLFQDTGARARMGAAARARVAAEFTHEKFAARLLAALGSLEVLGSAAARPGAANLDSAPAVGQTGRR